jgi:OmcA/MtrC family decaheme c-type cytochrome
MCHVPNLSTSGRTANVANVNQANKDALNAAGYDAEDALTYPEWTNNMKEMIHAIHAAHVKTVPFHEVRVRGTSVTYYDFSHVTYPTAPNNCLMCHKPGTYDMLPERVLSTVFVTDNGEIATPADVADARDTVPNANDWIQTPYAAACAACHDTPLAAAHMEQNGAYVDWAREDVPQDFAETCGLCHGAGRAADVNVVHGL